MKVIVERKLTSRKNDVSCKDPLKIRISFFGDLTYASVSSRSNVPG